MTSSFPSYSLTTLGPKKPGQVTFTIDYWLNCGPKGFPLFGVVRLIEQIVENCGFYEVCRQIALRICIH